MSAQQLGTSVFAYKRKELLGMIEAHVAGERAAAAKLREAATTDDNPKHKERLEDVARSHERRAENFEFVAEHLAPGQPPHGLFVMNIAELLAFRNLLAVREANVMKAILSGAEEAPREVEDHDSLIVRAPRSMLHVPGQG